MRYNPLGRTGIFVSELCLGTMTFGGRGIYQAIGQVSETEAERRKYIPGAMAPFSQTGLRLTSHGAALSKACSERLSRGPFF